MVKNKTILFKNATLAFVVMMLAASMTGCKDYEENDTGSEKETRELYEKLKNQDPRYHVDKEEMDKVLSEPMKKNDSFSR